MMVQEIVVFVSFSVIYRRKIKRRERKKDRVLNYFYIFVLLELFGIFK